MSKTEQWVVLMALAAIGVADLYDNRSILGLGESRNIKELRIEAKRLFPRWSIQGTDAVGFYLVAKDGHAEGSPPWEVDSRLYDPDIDRISRQPFDANAWRQIVFARPLDWFQEAGWRGPLLIKGPFLFYGDREMLQQIDRDLR